jgi:four helix bundle protein
MGGERDGETERRRDEVKKKKEENKTVANVKTFRDLIAWQKAMELAQLIYRQTSHMPSEERFGLTMQMRRAAVSVPSNIAEGFGREKRIDLIRFLRVARGSLNELATQYEIAVNLNMLRDGSPTVDLIHETDRVLQALINSLRAKL